MATETIPPVHHDPATVDPTTLVLIAGLESCELTEFHHREHVRAAWGMLREGGLLETLERVNRELGTTTAVITHNVPIAQMADTVVELVDGQVSRIEHRESKLPPHELRW